MSQTTMSRPRTSDRLDGSRPHRLDPVTAVGISAAVSGVFGLVSGVLTPRGPVTGGEGLATMAAALAVGAVAGFVQRSRWAAAIAAVAYAAAVELTRIGLVGPTVDAPHASFLGLIAFVTGRGIHGLLVFLPMILGAFLGAAMARTRATGKRRSGLEQTVGVVGTLAVIALAVGVARPAATDPIVDTNGQVVAGSIAEFATIDVEGRDLTMMIRGRSTDSPVVLFLAGGPGGTELGAMRRHLESLEDHFVVVTLDQRGAGKSYGALDPASTLTVESSIDDTVAVTRYLSERFDQERIYLLGQSWGTILGPLVVERHPELYEAYIGTGQMVSPSASDRIIYEDMLAWASDSGDSDTVSMLRRVGSPPYDDITLYEPVLGREQDTHPYDRSQNSEGAAAFSENLFVEEYTLLEQIHAMGAMLDTYSVLYPQIQDLDFRVDLPRLDVPVYFVEGAHEAPGRTEPFAEWFQMLDAPTKRLVTLETSGHRPLFEQPAEFAEFMAGILTEDA